MVGHILPVVLAHVRGNPRAGSVGTPTPPGFAQVGIADSIGRQG